MPIGGLSTFSFYNDDFVTVALRDAELALHGKSLGGFAVNAPRFAKALAVTDRRNFAVAIDQLRYPNGSFNFHEIKLAEGFPSASFF